MPEARLLRLTDLMNIQPETTVFIETKQTLRPAFFMGVLDRFRDFGITGDSRYAIHLLTAAKIAKYWEWRLNNKTWRVWSAKPTREQRLEARWDADDRGFMKKQVERLEYHINIEDVT